MLIAIVRGFTNFRNKEKEQQQAFAKVVEYMKDHWRDKVFTFFRIGKRNATVL